MNEIKLIPLTNENIDYDLLTTWCQKKHVYEWFEQQKLTKEKITEKYQKKLNESNQTLLYIEINSQKIGYAQYYSSQEENVYEFDLFIGEEEYLGKGFGREIIIKIEEFIQQKHPVKAFILESSKRNMRACKCYEKSGYHKIKEYVGKNTIGEETIFCTYQKVV